MEIEEQDKWNIAFEFRGNVYEWSGMVMGYRNSPIVMQKIMNKLFDDLIGKSVMVYMDDIFIFSENEIDHYKAVDKVIKRLDQAKLRVNPSKIQFCQSEVKLLGMPVDGKERMTISVKKEKAIKANKPRKITELRSFLGQG